MLIAVLGALLFAAPWIGANALICWRTGARLLWSDANGAFPTQSDQWRAVSGR